MVKGMLALGAAMLALPGQPAAAQHALPEIETRGITGANIDLGDFHDPDDVVPIRPGRRCRLDAGAAQRLAVALKRVRANGAEWEGLTADMVIRFDGARGRYGELIAVIAVLPRGEVETRAFYAGESAYLLQADRVVVGQIVADAGCPLLTWPEKE